MSDLRPISLCSVLYKVISKILVKRLQPLLSDIVSPNQSAFVEERLISDNILIAHELIHGLRTHPRISSQFMALKSDMSKAFDRVEWSYLQALLSALGFHPQWIRWIMFCVTSVTFSILINDQAFGLIKPGRGLRQGDPLSPFFFVLCSEGLTHLLNRAERNGNLNGIQFSDTGPSVHHLLFADDSLFLCKAEHSQINTLKGIMEGYGEATGQRVNLNKSSITFGANVEESCKLDIKTSLGIMNEGGAGTYLGLPECFSGSKIQLLDYIKDKLKARLNGWFARSLSLGGKEILLKAVAMAMPVYAMLCFKLTKPTCDNLTSAMGDFWWNALENKKKIHWVSWERLCLSKVEGGLGFKDIQAFNQALLAKQAWRLIQQPDCLFAQLMKSRYYEWDEFLDANMSARPSYAWRSILHGRALLVMGLRKMVGNGKSLNVWIDSWIYDDVLRAPLIKNPLIDIDMIVEDLIDVEARDWDRDVLEDLFYPNDILLILSKKPVVSKDDFWCWELTKSGEYSVNSGYWFASRFNNHQSFHTANLQPSLNALKEQVWLIQTAPKLKVFMWRALSAALPVATLLNHKGMSIDERCQFCAQEGESINHILFTCPIARQVWALSEFPFPLDGFSENFVYQNFQALYEIKKNLKIPLRSRRCFPWILWRLWKNRNKLCIEGLSYCPQDTVAKISEDMDEWFSSQLISSSVSVEESISVQAVVRIWKPPPQNWLKCNIGLCWSKQHKIACASWVVRNAAGEVVVHSRRAFFGLQDKSDSYLSSITWAIESMHSLHLDKVIFASEAKDIIEAFRRPKA